MIYRCVIILLSVVCVLSGCTSSQEVIAIQEQEDTSLELIEQSTDLQESNRKDIYVYVCGYVYQPGVYSLENGARVCDALAMAGGVTSDGKPEALNQAEFVTDGQTIYVPSKEEYDVGAKEEDDLININKADRDLLMTLPGIGQSKADLIIQYREENGAFQTIEDLMDIPGIKDGVFDKIKNYIKVS